jgi:hypothetical protein
LKEGRAVGRKDGTRDYTKKERKEIELYYTKEG